MDFPTALLRDLLELSASIDDAGDGDLDARLAALVAALGAAVPSYRGLSVTVHDNGYPVRLTSFLPTADGRSPPRCGCRSLSSRHSSTPGVG